MLTGRSIGPTVESLMTRSPVVVTEDDAIVGVAELLAGYEITGLPVVDAADAAGYRGRAWSSAIWTRAGPTSDQQPSGSGGRELVIAAER